MSSHNQERQKEASNLVDKINSFYFIKNAEGVGFDKITCRNFNDSLSYKNGLYTLKKKILGQIYTICIEMEGKGPNMKGERKLRKLLSN